MYKTTFIEHRNGGFDIQTGKTEILDERINAWAANGWELVCITPCPYLTNPAKMGYAVTFKSKEEK